MLYVLLRDVPTRSTVSTPPIRRCRRARPRQAPVDSSREDRSEHHLGRWPVGRCSTLRAAAPSYTAGGNHRISAHDRIPADGSPRSSCSRRTRTADSVLVSAISGGVARRAPRRRQPPGCMESGHSGSRGGTGRSWSETAAMPRGRTATAWRQLRPGRLPTTLDPRRPWRPRRRTGCRFVARTAAPSC